MSVYKTISKGVSTNNELSVTTEQGLELKAFPPEEFGGPGKNWTPEDLFSASISSCYILTFKVLASHKKLDFTDIEVEVDAHLEKTETGFRFTKVDIYPKLTVCCSGNVDPYLEALVKAKKHCLVTSSMNCEFVVHPKVKNTMK